MYSNLPASIFLAPFPFISVNGNGAIYISIYFCKWKYIYICIPLFLNLHISELYMYTSACCTLRTCLFDSGYSPLPSPDLLPSAHLVTLQISPIILRALALIPAPLVPRLCPCQLVSLCVSELTLQALSPCNGEQVVICRGLMLLIKLQMLTMPSQVEVASTQLHKWGSRTARCPV